MHEYVCTMRGPMQQQEDPARAGGRVFRARFRAQRRDRVGRGGGLDFVVEVQLAPRVWSWLRERQPQQEGQEETVHGVMRDDLIADMAIPLHAPRRIEVGELSADLQRCPPAPQANRTFVLWGWRQHRLPQPADAAIEDDVRRRVRELRARLAACVVSYPRGEAALHQVDDLLLALRSRPREGWRLVCRRFIDGLVPRLVGSRPRAPAGRGRRRAGPADPALTRRIDASADRVRP